MYNIKYLLMKNEDVLIATLAEDDNVVLYLDGGEWIKFDKCLSELKKEHKIVKISAMDAFIIMFGCFPHKYFKMLGYQIYEKPIKESKDSFLDFMESFKSFAIEDYSKKFHNKNQTLKYSAFELDTHYENAGYLWMFDKYFLEYLNRKNHGEFDYVEVVKFDGDYSISFNESILK